MVLVKVLAEYRKSNGKKEGDDEQHHFMKAHKIRKRAFRTRLQINFPVT
jgi:hypothetical protein